MSVTASTQRPVQQIKIIREQNDHTKHKRIEYIVLCCTFTVNIKKFVAK